jgi:hypothetical protein
MAGFDNKHFLIRRMRRHLVTQFSVASNAVTTRRVTGVDNKKLSDPSTTPSSSLPVTQ